MALQYSVVIDSPRSSPLRLDAQFPRMASVGRLGVRQLIDGDLASKNGSRKWLGGTGTDINQTFASISKVNLLP
ncbi:hypothetical protein BJV77DRAFT_976498, partial [Russula vinacea]